MKYKVNKLILSLFIFSFGIASAQDYEIQVYGSDILKNILMTEVHSNYTFGGIKEKENGILPTHHMLHETLELTYGFTDCWEIGFYLFNAVGSGNFSSVVGSHLSSKIVAPAKWHLPFGLGLSAETGTMKMEYVEDDWGLEIRPIIDKKINEFYLSFNPVLEKSLHGAGQYQGFTFSPNVKISFGVAKKTEFGIEYYGGIAPYNDYLKINDQQHLLFVTTDIDWWEKWEINVGYGFALTKSTPDAILKTIIGYKLGRNHKQNKS